MLSSRWLSLIAFVIIVALVTIWDKSSVKYKIQRYGMMFSEGMVGGFIVDIVGINAGYYYFPRQPFMSLDYWIIVIPCWGVFGLFLNYLWRVVAKDRFIKGTLFTLPTLIAWYEGTNLYTHSWVYTVPFYWVVLGWIPLTYVFSGCDHRREVVYKMDYLIKTTDNHFIQKGLSIVRYVLTIIMFPLLITSIVKITRDVFILKKLDISLKEYALEYLMVTR